MPFKSIYLFFITFSFIIIPYYSASIYDATLSVDTSSRCQFPSSEPSTPKLVQSATCGCSDNYTAPSFQESIKEEKCPEQPLRLLTMVSRIPLSSSTNCRNDSIDNQPETIPCSSSTSPVSIPCEPQSIPSPPPPKPCTCVATTTTQEISPAYSCTTSVTKGRVFLRRGQTGKIITKANHIAPIEKVSIAYDVATLAVPTTFTVVRTDYVPLTQTKTHVQTFAWTTFTVDDNICPISSSIVIKPTTTCSSINTRISSSSTKECQLATLCRKKKSKAIQTTTIPELFENENFNLI